MKQESLLGNENDPKASGPDECLGMTFESDEARRAHFIELLREKLKDPEFRAIEGFPIGTDEAILELSDPPYYTACPNPWLNDFVELWESQKENSTEDYHREPFAADVSEGKNDRIYNAHAYHTKVPHKAVMRYILHYTSPGDIVFDGFCGTGMTGVAAYLCGSREEVESLGYKVDANGVIYELVNEATNTWKQFSSLGSRKCFLNDLSPMATLISNSYNQANISREVFDKATNEIIDNIQKKYSWMFQTKHSNGAVGEINYIIWSDVFLCPECSSEMVFWDVAVNKNEGKVINDFTCPSCGIELTKRKLIKCLFSNYDKYLETDTKCIKQNPVLINYKYGKKNYQKKPDSDDLALIEKISQMAKCDNVPAERLIFGQETRRNDKIGITHTHQFYTDRTLIIFSEFMKQASQDLYWVLTGCLQRGSKQHQVAITRVGGPKAGEGGATAGHRRGTLYVPSNQIEMNSINLLKDRARAISKSILDRNDSTTIISTASTSALDGLPNDSMDYLFFDPPFGANIAYSELNFVQESWVGVFTNQTPEAIEDKPQKKTIFEYRDLIKECFKVAYRVLKPGRWITVEFSNTSASVWNVIQDAIQTSGFVISNVAALDKKRGGLNSIVGPTAVKQDLAITAYKPTQEVTTLIAKKIDESSVWTFVRSHLEHLVIVKKIDNSLVKVQERDPRIIYDRCISFFLRNNYEIPLSSRDFQRKLSEKFVERDEMYFLSDQVADYDKARALVSHIEQLSIFVDDEASAINWMRQELKSKPKTYSEIHPLFLNELSGWKKNELELELSTLLEQNFLKYDGKDEVPAQIHTYLSTNFKDMRGLDKSDPKLVAKAKDRWYVPDPNKAADLEKVRLRALLKEFETYKEEKKKIKQPRAEALRAGFNTAWEAQDFQTILDISAKIPPAVLQEDEKLLMFYDNALTLTSTEDDEW
jgi:DNA modification methylase